VVLVVVVIGWLVGTMPSRGVNPLGPATPTVPSTPAPPPVAVARVVEMRRESNGVTIRWEWTEEGKAWRDQVLGG
jgi:hypothetical protein